MAAEKAAIADHLAVEKIRKKVQHEDTTSSGKAMSIDKKEYEIITKARPFFKKGRFFMAFWTEPMGSNQAFPSGTLQTYFETFRRFIVIRSKPGHCLCLSVHTYRRRGTSKPGVRADDHAAVIPVGGSVKLHPEEKALSKEPIHVIVEDPTVTIHETSRVDFSRVYTIEYNIPVKKVGRVCPMDLHKFEDYFSKCMNLPPQPFDDSSLFEISWPFFLGENSRGVALGGQNGDRERSSILNLQSVNYAIRKERIPSPVFGTGRWLLSLPRYKDWLASKRSILWIAGKSRSENSILSKWLVDSELRKSEDVVICYFFFEQDGFKGSNWLVALQALLHQLLVVNSMGENNIELRAALSGDDQKDSFTVLWKEFLNIAALAPGRVVCVLDGFDECHPEKGRRCFIKAFEELYLDSKGVDQGPQLSFAVTSRLFTDLQHRFTDHLCDFPSREEQVIKKLNETLAKFELDAQEAFRYALAFEVEDSYHRPLGHKTVYVVDQNKVADAIQLNIAQADSVLSMLKSLKHPNIVKPISIYAQDAGFHTFLFPAIQHDIKTMLLGDSQDYPRGLRSEAQIIAQLWGVSSAIEAIHKYEPIHEESHLTGFHGDIKLHNVAVSGGRFLLSDSGVLRLLDVFGCRSKSQDYRNVHLEPDDIRAQVEGRINDVRHFGCVLMLVLVHLRDGPETVANLIQRLNDDFLYGKLDGQAEIAKIMTLTRVQASKEQFALSSLLNEMMRTDPYQGLRLNEITSRLFHIPNYALFCSMKQELEVLKNEDLKLRFEYYRLVVWGHFNGVGSEYDKIRANAWLAAPRSYKELQEVESLLGRCESEIKVIFEVLKPHNERVPTPYCRLRQLLDELWDMQETCLYDDMNDFLASLLNDDNYLNNPIF